MANTPGLINGGDDAGHEISGRTAVEISSRKGAAKAAAKAASETTEDARDQRLG